MTHAEILAKSEAYRKGEVAAAPISGFGAQVQACKGCLEVV